MKHARVYPVDHSAVLFLSQLRRDFANSFRVTATLDAEVSPKLLEQATERIYSRFPTVFAGFRPGFFGYSLFPAPKAPDVQPDTGLLRTMEVEEIQRGPYRILHSGRAVSIELFHALTDGYGAIAIIRRLLQNICTFVMERICRNAMMGRQTQRCWRKKRATPARGFRPPR